MADPKSFDTFQRARAGGEKAIREAVFWWVMDEGPAEMTIAHTRSLSRHLTRVWNLEAQALYTNLTGVEVLEGKEPE